MNGAVTPKGSEGLHDLYRPALTGGLMAREQVEKEEGAEKHDAKHPGKVVIGRPLPPVTEDLLQCPSKTDAQPTFLHARYREYHQAL
jgi:hypothetical protein